MTRRLYTAEYSGGVPQSFSTEVRRPGDNTEDMEGNRGCAVRWTACARLCMRRSRYCVSGHTSGYLVWQIETARLGVVPYFNASKAQDGKRFSSRFWCESGSCGGEKAAQSCCSCLRKIRCNPLAICQTQAMSGRDKTELTSSLRCWIGSSREPAD